MAGAGHDGQHTKSPASGRFQYADGFLEAGAVQCDSLSMWNSPAGTMAPLHIQDAGLSSPSPPFQSSHPGYYWDPGVVAMSPSPVQTTELVSLSSPQLSITSAWSVATAAAAMPPMTPQGAGVGPPDPGDVAAPQQPRRSLPTSSRPVSLPSRLSTSSSPAASSPRAAPRPRKKPAKPTVALRPRRKDRKTAAAARAPTSRAAVWPILDTMGRVEAAGVQAHNLEVAAERKASERRRNNQSAKRARIRKMATAVALGDEVLRLNGALARAAAEVAFWRDMAYRPAPGALPPRGSAWARSPLGPPPVGQHVLEEGYVAEVKDMRRCLKEYVDREELAAICTQEFHDEIAGVVRRGDEIREGLMAGAGLGAARGEGGRAGVAGMGGWMDESDVLASEVRETPVKTEAGGDDEEG